VRRHLRVLRRESAPVMLRGVVLLASIVAASLLIRVQGLGVFGLLVQLQFLARIGGSLMLGASQLRVARRATSVRDELTWLPQAVPRATVALTGAGVAAWIVSDRFGATTGIVVLLVVMTAVYVVVSALLRLAALKLGQAGHTSLSAISDISVVAPVAALTFTIPSLGWAAAVQVGLMLALGVWCLRYLFTGDRVEPVPAPPANTLRPDLVAFVVTVLPMLHGSVGPVLGTFGLGAEAVGLLALAQRLASAGPLIMAGANASVLAVPIDRAMEPTTRFAKWGGLAFAVNSLVVVALWPVVRGILDLPDADLMVVVLVLVANLVIVCGGPIGQFCAVSGMQRLDFLSLVAAALVLVPFLVVTESATTGAIAAVVIAVVRVTSVWYLVLRFRRDAHPSTRATPSAEALPVE
jgi:hypothetical protein